MSEFFLIEVEKSRVDIFIFFSMCEPKPFKLNCKIDSSFGEILNVTVNPCQLSFYECDEDNYTSICSRAFQRAKELSISVESFLGFVSRH